MPQPTDPLTPFGTPVADPMQPFRQFLDMCRANAIRTDQMTAHDEWITSFRQALEDDYGLDTSDPKIVAAVLAGIVEGVTAVREHDSASIAALLLGWAVWPLAVPHLSPIIETVRV